MSAVPTSTRNAILVEGFCCTAIVRSVQKSVPVGNWMTRARIATRNAARRRTKKLLHGIKHDSIPDEYEETDPVSTHASERLWEDEDFVHHNSGEAMGLLRSQYFTRFIWSATDFGAIYLWALQRRRFIA